VGTEKGIARFSKRVKRYWHGLGLVSAMGILIVILAALELLGIAPFS